MLWRARPGSPWRGLPDKSGAWNSPYKRLARCPDAGVWQRLAAKVVQGR
ncbi:transposase [Candidatus Methylobacter favarea]